MNDTHENKKERPVKGQSERWVPAIYGLLVAGYLLSTSEQVKTLYQRVFMETSIREIFASPESAMY